MAPAPESRAVMALAFSKAVRRGFFMEKAVELGAHAIWLWQGDHSQGKLPADAAEACRGQLIAGAKQCGNPWLPQVEALTGGVDELVRRAATADRRILPWEMQDTVSMLTPQCTSSAPRAAFPSGSWTACGRRSSPSSAWGPVCCAARPPRPCAWACTGGPPIWRIRRNKGQP